MNAEVASDPLRKRRSSSEGPFPVRLRLLGGFSVWVGSRAVGEGAWRLRKAKSLVKLLALAPGHRLHREQLMDLLWPNLDRRAASNNLRRALHVARRELESEPSAPRYLVSHGEHLALCSDGPLSVDIEAFEEVAATARRSRDPQAYRAALDLYAGDLLPEDPYEDWAEDRRRQLRQNYLALLAEMAELCEERGDLGSAIDALREAVSEEPEHEQAHANLMRMYAKSGHRHKALRQYERLCQALRREFGTEPGMASRRLHEEIVAGRVPATRSVSTGGIPSESTSYSPRHNVPAALSSFVGRERELMEVKRALAMARLLTLSGAGGCGKTRLALEVTRDLASSYPDGAWLVELASLSHPELVPHALASVLGLREQPDRSLVDTLVGHLREKYLLLMLDNCEHLIEACAQLASLLLHSCPRLRVLATSREALGVEGEAVWRVSSLSVPDTDRLPTANELTRYDAVHLFLDRARLRVPDFELTPENGRAVAQVCRRLEGIPLAIELATARVGPLAVEEVVQRLEDSLGLLTTGPRTAPPRQRTMRATLQWSHGFLSEPETKLFRRLSAFAGGWTLEAAEAVGSDGLGGANVLDVLSRLVEKSLVVAEATEGDGLRYRMLELIRQYARKKLEEDDKPDATLRRHTNLFLALAEEAEPELKGPRQQEWLERLEVEHDNFRAALTWALDRGKVELGLRLSGALGEFWHMRGHLGEGRQWLELALAAQGGAYLMSARAKAFTWAAHIAWEQGDYERSITLSKGSLTLFRTRRDEAGVADALSNLAWAALFQNELEQASTMAEEALTLQCKLGHTVGVIRALQTLGLVAATGHNYDRAAALYEESLMLARKVGDSFGLVLSLGIGALASLGKGDHHQTRMLYEKGLRGSKQLKTMNLARIHLYISAALAGAQGRAVRSARLLGATEVMREAIGTIFSPAERRAYGPYIEAARAQLDEAAWEKAYTEGKTMTLEEAIEYALSGEEEPPPSAVPAPEELPAVLTRREREVVIFVAQGLTNRQIAKELVVSERTVEKHVANILKKLGLHSREQVDASMIQRRA
ncbi:MAG TPA: BTAD domain-containing putative transcriptional regulator [Rubrobacter sp.]|nr:BTAD domain-containing putative transcriptional regulator [Rubrobacter sp.]